MDNKSQENLELFKTLHGLQYDRIAKLESQENFITSFVTGLSTITIAFAFAKDVAHTAVNSFLLPFVFIIANIIAIKYIKKTRVFVKMHQARADEMRKTFAPEFNDIYLKVDKHNSVKDKYNRTSYLIFLHYSIAGIGLVMIISFIYNLFF